MTPFDRLVHDLSERFGADPVVPPGLGPDAGIVLFPVDPDLDPDDVLAERESVRRQGAFLFFYEPPTGEDEYVVGLADTPDPFAVIERLGVRGVPGPSTADIVAFLRGITATDPIDITTIAAHAVGGLFIQPPRNLRALARRVYEGCPLVYENLKAILEEEPEAAEDLNLPEDLPWHDPIEVLTAALGQGPDVFFFWDEEG